MEADLGCWNNGVRPWLTEWYMELYLSYCFHLSEFNYGGYGGIGVNYVVLLLKVKALPQRKSKIYKACQKRSNPI